MMWRVLEILKKKATGDVRSKSEPEDSGASSSGSVLSRGLDWLESASQLWVTKKSTPAILFYTIITFIFVVLVWASVAELDHVIRGQGKVVTPKQTQLMQSLEGGIIERIYVREGDIVHEGAVLIGLDPTQAKSLYGETRKEERALVVRVERLLAEKEDREPVFSYEIMRNEAEIISAEKAQLKERREVLETELSLLESQVDQRFEDQKQAEAELVRAEKEFELAGAEFDLIKDLVDRRLEARLSLIDVDRDRNEAVAQLNKAKVSLRKSTAALAESQHRLKQARMTYVSDVGDEYADGVVRLAEVREKLQGLKDRLNRTQLFAPLNAIVNKIHIRTEGGVVQSGEPILELTPIDGKIEVEASILQKDIAFVHVDQAVSVKLTAYDFSRFGDVSGKVTFISPDAQKNEDGAEFFQVRIQLEQSFVGVDGGQYPVTPGMAADVDMVIAKRTVMEYLMEPVFKLRDRAFRE
jgi:adhesin transport system membrane fusion protein